MGDGGFMFPDLMGGFETPQFDMGTAGGGFDLAGSDLGSDFGASFGSPAFSPPSPGNQDWLNSLGTGAGTYGTGMDWENAPITLGKTQPPASGGFGFGDFMKAGAGGLGALGNILGLGVSGLGMANAVRAMQQGGQQQKILNQAQQQAQQVAQPAAQAGSSLTRAGEAAMLGGPLPEQMELLAQKRKAETRAKIQSYLAKSGISDSTMAAQFESWIEQNDAVFRQTMAEKLLAGGYAGIGTAMGPIGQSGQMAAGQMGGTDKFLREANNSIALLTGAQRGAVS